MKRSGKRIVISLKTHSLDLLGFHTGPLVEFKAIALSYMEKNDCRYGDDLPNRCADNPGGANTVAIDHRCQGSNRMHMELGGALQNWHTLQKCCYPRSKKMRTIRKAAPCDPCFETRLGE